MTTPQRLLLAGAGDLCRRTARVLAGSGMDIYGVRRNPPPATMDPGITWIAADLTCLQRAVLPEGITHVLFAPTPDRRTAQAYQDVFLTALTRLLEQLDLDRLQRFLFVSSSAVYGANTDWITERTPTVPEGFNGKILLEAERHLQTQLPDKSVRLRLSGLYGPGRIGLLKRLQDGNVTVPGTGSQWANRIHIDDAARACAHLLTLTKTMPCYIGTDSQPYQIGELYRALAAMLNAPSPKAAEQSESAADLPPQDSSPTKQPEIGKRLSNARLLQSGFALLWPDALSGYRAQIEASTHGSED